MAISDIETLFKVLNNCKVYDLEQPRFEGMPISPSHRPGFSYLLYRRHVDQSGKKRRTPASGLIVMGDQTGTHIDAICHQAYDLKLFGNVEVDNTIETSAGFKKLGAETIPPIVKRGILLDIAREKDHNQHGLISKQDLIECSTKEHVSILAEDVLLIRTGKGALWNDDHNYRGNRLALGPDAVSWLAEKKIFALGVDAMSPDHADPKDADPIETGTAHLELLAKRGIYIIENVALENIAKDECYKFLFVGLPLKFVGATGSPIRPIAIVPSKR